MSCSHPHLFYSVYCTDATVQPKQRSPVLGVSTVRSSRRVKSTQLRTLHSTSSAGVAPARAASASASVVTPPGGVGVGVGSSAISGSSTATGSSVAMSLTPRLVSRAPKKSEHDVDSDVAAIVEASGIDTGDAVAVMPVGSGSTTAIGGIVASSRAVSASGVVEQPRVRVCYVGDHVTQV